MEANDYNAFDCMLEGIQVISPDFRYVYVNQSVLDHAKTIRGKLLGNTMMEQYPGIEKTEMFSHLKDCMQNKQAHTIENKFTYPDGEIRYFELRMQPVSAGVLIMSLDITDRKKMEIELKRMNSLLDEMVSERTTELLHILDKEKRINEISSKFISLVSHEFKTPLVAIKVTVNALQDLDKKADRETLKKHLANLNTSIGDMFELLDEYLSIDKINPDNIFFDPQVFSLKDLVEKEVANLQELCKEGQKINIDYIGEDKIKQDQKIIKSILINLLSNAIKYSDDTIELIVELDNDRIQLDVIDQGIGIPEEDQVKLFHQYFRASNTHGIQGTGMGLNIVKQYVESLKGYIGFHSTPGEGTHFTVTLPNYVYAES